jgi:hypothetical protein
MFTLRDAEFERQMNDPGLARYLEHVRENRRITNILIANPDIGELCVNGKRVFYAFLNGYNQDPVKSFDPADLVPQ